MTDKKGGPKKRKVAWGITGAGDRLSEYVQTMKVLQKEYGDLVEVHVFASKAAETVLKFYNLEMEVKQNFTRYLVEVNANAPFLAAWLQLRKYDLFLIAPASSNTVAKIAYCIADTMLTNAASMSLKAFSPVYVFPVDYEEKTVDTILPNGKTLKLRIRKEDVENVRKLERMQDVHVLTDPQQIRGVFRERFEKV